MSKFIQSLRTTTIAFIAIFSFVLVGAGTAPSVHAEDRPTTQTDDVNTRSEDDGQNSPRVQQRENLELKRQELQSAKDAAEARLKARHEARQEKLSASQLEICKGRQANINNRIARIADRSTKHLELFTKISERAQAFYVSKDITLENYDALVSDVAEKKLAAGSAVASINDTTTNFDCNGENPKLSIEEFKISLKTSIDVLKEYRTSVKNLIVGIKTAATSETADESLPTSETEDETR